MITTKIFLYYFLISLIGILLAIGVIGLWEGMDGLAILLINTLLSSSLKTAMLIVLVVLMFVSYAVSLFTGKREVLRDLIIMGIIGFICLWISYMVIFSPPLKLREELRLLGNHPNAFFVTQTGYRFYEKGSGGGGGLDISLSGNRNPYVSGIYAYEGKIDKEAILEVFRFYEKKARQNGWDVTPYDPLFIGYDEEFPSLYEHMGSKDTLSLWVSLDYRSSNSEDLYAIELPPLFGNNTLKKALRGKSILQVEIRDHR